MLWVGFVWSWEYKKRRLFDKVRLLGAGSGSFFSYFGRRGEGAGPTGPYWLLVALIP